ncbi:hypothetical protein Tco_1051854, partial [Tanacetum coccineum]
MRLITMSSFDIIKMKSRRSWEDHHFEESGGDVFDLIGDVDPTDEDGDIGMGDSTGKTDGGSIGACGGIGTGYSLKDKNEAKPDKTEHGFEKSMKNQGQ